MKLFKNQYMEIAIKEAYKSLKSNKEIPVGCVIVDNKTKKILSVSTNKTLENNDPTAHAEIIAIREACKKINNYRLEDTSIFVTLEPCKMCMEAIKQARIKNVYFGAYSDKKDIDNHSFSTIEEFYNEECSNILKEFFKKRR